MPLILLRHTRPEGCEGLCYGRHDPPLGPDLARAAARLAALLPGFATLVTSPLGRCRVLADALGAEREVEPVLDERLAEMDFGMWENRPWDAIPRAEIDAWAADLLHARPHGGESVAMLRDRVAPALARWRRAPGPVLVVTHAGVIRAARALAGEPGAWQSRLAHGGWLVL